MLKYGLIILALSLAQISCTLSANISALDSLSASNKSETDGAKDKAPVANPLTAVFSSSPDFSVVSNTFQVTVTFSEAVTGFDVTQLAVSNGVVQNFSGSGAVYTFDFVPNSEGEAGISILSGAVKDGVNNLLPAGSALNKYYDKDVVRAYFLETDSSVVESTSSITRTLMLTGSKPYAMTAHIDILGSAIKGSDYTLDPFDLQIPANTTQVSFNVDVFANSTMDQGDRKLILNISDTSTNMLRAKDPSFSVINILEDDRSVNYGLVADATLGYYHSCIRYQSGVVKCWGQNTYGAIGIGSTTDTAVPAIVDSSTSYAMISSGGRGVCGIITSTSKVKCWGWNGYGEVGDGTYTQRNSPVSIDAATSYLKVVVGGSENGGQTACGITSANDLKCWGDNQYGQYGNGTNTSSTTPVVLHAGTKYSDISVGGLFTCGITTAGQLRCWGVNWDGQLADGTFNDSNVPLNVDVGVNYSMVSAGGYHACGITTGGVLKCWGLGKGTGTNSTSTVASPTVVDSGVTYSFIAAGEEGACAITSAGVLKCWGNNEFGQVGNTSVPVASTSNQLIPIVVDSGVSYQKVAMQRTWAGGSSSVHACGVTTAGDLKCWGSNSSSQLGQVTYSTSPRAISNETFSSMQTYPGKVVGLTTAGNYLGQGSNYYNELADSVAKVFIYPFRVFMNTTYTSLLTTYSTCGISTSQDLYCWGYNTTGEVGDGTTVNKSSPVQIDSGTKYVKVSGDSTKCAITTTGVLKCWGSNSYGQVGDGTTVNKKTPVIVDSGTNYKEVKSYGSTSCGITSTNALKCWGLNTTGQVGDGTTVNKTVPTLINSGTSYSSIEISGILNCGITDTGVLKCWGNNLYGAVGDGTATNKTTPTVVDSGTAYSFVKTNYSITCGITAANDLKCWGRNTYGGVGDGSLTNRLSPTLIDSGVKYSKVSTSGMNGACAITIAGDLKCWGRNNLGNVGDGSIITRTSPVIIDNGIKYSDVAVTISAPGTCGLTQAGKIKCWGPVVELQSASYNSPTPVLNIH